LLLRERCNVANMKLVWSLWRRSRSRDYCR